MQPRQLRRGTLHHGIHSYTNERKDRSELIARTKSSWAQELTSMDHEDDDPGTNWNERARRKEPKKMSPRMAWRAIQKSLPHENCIETLNLKCSWYQTF